MEDFDKDNARNVKILELITVHHLMLIILRISFLILHEGDTFGNNGSFSAPEEKFIVNFSEANTQFCLSL